MKIYHGSDTLSNQKVPDPFYENDNNWNGSFFSLEKELAQEFGETVHEFEIDESYIFDMRKPEHQRLLVSKIKINNIINVIDQNLPIAFSRNSDNDLIQEIKNIIKLLGFAGWYLKEVEWTNQPISIEIWEKSIIKVSGP